MSSKLLGQAFAADMGTRSRKLVLLKLVDHCRDDGTKIFPAVASVAAAAQCSDRQVQREIAEMLKAGLLTLVRQGGKGPGSTNEYALDVSLLDRIVSLGWAAVTGDTKGDAASPIEAKGDTTDTERVTPPTEKGDASVTRTLKGNPQEEPLEDFERDARERAIDRPVIEELPDHVLLDRIRKAHPQAAHADQDDVEAAWLALDVEERAAAARLIEAWLATKVGRHPLGLAKYLRQKLWTLLPEAQPAKATERTSLRAFTQEWWAVWLERVEAGETVRFMSDEALANRDWIVQGPAPPKMVIDRLVPIPLNSLEHRAWTDHLAKVGVRLPRPLGAGAVWMPTKTPTPGFGAVKQKQVA